MVTLYSKPGCPQCMATKRDLDKLKISYTYINVSENLDAYAYLKSRDILSLPFVETDDEDWTSYRPDKIKSLAASDSE